MSQLDAWQIWLPDSLNFKTIRVISEEYTGFLLKHIISFLVIVGFTSILFSVVQLETPLPTASMLLNGGSTSSLPSTFVGCLRMSDAEESFTYCTMGMSTWWWIYRSLTHFCSSPNDNSWLMLCWWTWSLFTVLSVCVLHWAAHGNLLMGPLSNQQLIEASQTQSIGEELI